MQPHPYQNLHLYPLTSSKNIWPKISVATSQNDFNLILLLVGGGCILSISTCCPRIHTHTELKKGLILKPEPDPIPKLQARTRLVPDILFLKPDLGLKAKLTERVKICATAK